MQSHTHTIDLPALPSSSPEETLPSPTQPSTPVPQISTNEKDQPSLSESEWYEYARLSLRTAKRSSLIIIMITVILVVGVIALQTQRNIVSVLSPTTIESGDPVALIRQAIKNYDELSENSSMISSYQEATSIAVNRIQEMKTRVGNTKKPMSFSDFNKIIENNNVWRTMTGGGKSGSSLITFSGGGYSTTPNNLGRIYNFSILVSSLQINPITRKLNSDSITISNFNKQVNEIPADDSRLWETVRDQFFISQPYEEHINLLNAIYDQITRNSKDLPQISSKTMEISSSLRDEILSQITHFNYIIFLRGALPITLLFLIAASAMAVLIRQIQFLNRISETEMAFLYAQSTTEEKIRPYQEIVSTFSPNRRGHADHDINPPSKEMISGIADAVKGLTDVLKK